MGHQNQDMRVKVNLFKFGEIRTKPLLVCIFQLRPSLALVLLYLSY